MGKGPRTAGAGGGERSGARAAALYARTEACKYSNKWDCYIRTSGCMSVLGLTGSTSLLATALH